jgi:polysaccharide export outer membrane protein
VRRAATIAVAGLGFLSLGGCFIPKDGPTGLEVRGAAEVLLEDTGRLSYAFVKLSPLTLKLFQTERQRVPVFSRLARVRPPAQVRVAASDVVSVSIFEAASGGLFIPSEAGARPGNFVQIPTQEIDSSGNINIPYGGPIRALGRTPREIEEEIVERLKGRAIEPQVIVTIGERSANAVSVLGDVRGATTIPLRPGGLRLLAAISRAGGPANAAHSSVVTVQRRGVLEQALLTTILKDPSSNIQLAPEDVVYVSYEPRIFMAFGATGQSSSIQIGTASISASSGRRFPMDRENISLAEALAQAGGVLSGLADPRSIFLFRYTPRDLLARGGIDVGGFPAADVPTVYTVDLSQAEGYFLANNFFMKHNDLIYISESPSVDLQKFLNIVNSVTSATSGVAGAISDVKALR